MDSSDFDMSYFMESYDNGEVYDEDEEYFEEDYM